MVDNRVHRVLPNRKEDVMNRVLRLHDECEHGSHHFGSEAVVNLGNPDGVLVNFTRIDIVWEQDCLRCGKTIERSFLISPQETGNEG